MRNEQDNLIVEEIRKKLIEFKKDKSWDDIAVIFKGQIHTCTLRNFLAGKHTPINATLSIIAKKVK